jgi:hypothetical protein
MESMNSKDSGAVARMLTALSTAGFVGLIYLGAFRFTEAEWWEWVGGVLLWLGPLAVLAQTRRS